MLKPKTIIKDRSSRRCYNNNEQTFDSSSSSSFSEESLQRWAIRYWSEKEDEDKPYVDLFSYPLSPTCVKWLEKGKESSSSYVASELATAFYGSIRFTPERWLLSLLVMNDNKKYYVLPDGEKSLFEVGRRYLFWTVASLSSHRFIATYGNKETFLGCTMVGFDPKGQKVYHGNCVYSQTAKGFLFQTLLPFHKWYAKFLLIGMANELERKATTLNSKQVSDKTNND